MTPCCCTPFTLRRQVVVTYSPLDNWSLVFIFYRHVVVCPAYNRDFTQYDIPALRLFMASRLLSIQKDGLRVHLERLSLRSDMSDLPISLQELFLHVSISSYNAGRLGCIPSVRSPIPSTFFSPSQEPLRKISRLHITPVRNSVALTILAVDRSPTAMNVQADSDVPRISPVRRMLAFGVSTLPAVRLLSGNALILQ